MCARVGDSYTRGGIPGQFGISFVRENGLAAEWVSVSPGEIECLAYRFAQVFEKK